MFTFRDEVKSEGTKFHTAFNSFIILVHKPWTECRYFLIEAIIALYDLINFFYFFALIKGRKVCNMSKISSVSFETTTSRSL